MFVCVCLICVNKYIACRCLLTLFLNREKNHVNKIRKYVLSNSFILFLQIVVLYFMKKKIRRGELTFKCFVVFDKGWKNFWYPDIYKLKTWIKCCFISYQSVHLKDYWQKIEDFKTFVMKNYEQKKDSIKCPNVIWIVIWC